MSFWYPFSAFLVSPRWTLLVSSAFQNECSFHLSELTHIPPSDPLASLCNIIHPSHRHAEQNGSAELVKRKQLNQSISLPFCLRVPVGVAFFSLRPTSQFKWVYACVIVGLVRSAKITRHKQFRISLSKHKQAQLTQFISDQHKFA